MSILDTHKIRSKFPYFKVRKNNHLIYFDNAATTQKPECVINAVTNFYINENSNIHRSVHRTGAIATQKYEETRTTVKNFISAKNRQNFCKARFIATLLVKKKFFFILERIIKG